MSYSIAIDGPAGAGKSTVAKLVAGQLGFIYVDTGAMYRAIALYMLRIGFTPENLEGVEEACEGADVTIRYEDGQQVVYLNGENVNTLIRTEEVSRMASAVSTRARVRSMLVELQRKLASRVNCIMDGRDIGTCVLPGADVKVYLTASSKVRAMRRFGELEEKGIACTLEEIQAEIEERDYRDMHREISPLKRADDAYLLDTSEMTARQAADAVIALCKGI